MSTIVPEKFEGRKIILVDELVDNGHTLQRMKEHLMAELKRPAEDIVTCAVFAKEIATRPAVRDSWRARSARLFAYLQCFQPTFCLFTRALIITGFFCLLFFRN